MKEEAGPSAETGPAGMMGRDGATPLPALVVENLVKTYPLALILSGLVGFSAFAVADSFASRTIL